MTSDADSVTAILRERARALASGSVKPTTPAGETLDVLEFRLDQETYAVESRWVQEVFPFKDLTPLPCTPPFVRGIVNVRGRIVPVLDLKRFFDLPEKGITDLHRIILIRGHDLEFGLLADVIGSIRPIALAELQPTLATLAGVGSDYLKGITAERLIVLDLARILTDPRIIVHEEVVT